MAKVSDGYTIGSVAQCIRDVITCKRMLQLRVKPLTHVELINALRYVYHRWSLFFLHGDGNKNEILIFSLFPTNVVVKHKGARLSRGRGGLPIMVCSILHPRRLIIQAAIFQVVKNAAGSIKGEGCRAGKRSAGREGNFGGEEEGGSGKKLNS